MAKGAESSLFRLGRCATVGCALVSGWLSVACIAEQSSNPTKPTEGLAVSGEVLAEVEIQPGYVVQLRELSPGNTIVFGTVNLDDAAGAPPFLADGETLGTVVDMYKHLHAKAGRVVTDADVPEAILAASLRSEERDRLLVEAGAEQAPLPSEVEKHTPIRTLSAECSPDVYGDDFGAQWFKDHMCNKLNSNIATTNVASYSASYDWTGIYWVGFAWLAADFWYGARVKANKCREYHAGVWPWGGPIYVCDVMADGYLPPRQGNFFYGKAYAGSLSLTGEGPCPRVHGCKMKTK